MESWVEVDPKVLTGMFTIDRYRQGAWGNTKEEILQYILNGIQGGVNTDGDNELAWGRLFSLPVIAMLNNCMAVIEGMDLDPIIYRLQSSGTSFRIIAFTKPRSKHMETPLVVFVSRDDETWPNATGVIANSISKRGWIFNKNPSPAQLLQFFYGLHETCYTSNFWSS